LEVLPLSSCQKESSTEITTQEFASDALYTQDCAEDLSEGISESIQGVEEIGNIMLGSGDVKNPPSENWLKEGDWWVRYRTVDTFFVLRNDTTKLKFTPDIWSNLENPEAPYAKPTKVEIQKYGVQTIKHLLHDKERYYDHNGYSELIGDSTSKLIKGEWNSTIRKVKTYHNTTANFTRTFNLSYDSLSIDPENKQRHLTINSTHTFINRKGEAKEKSIMSEIKLNQFGYGNLGSNDFQAGYSKVDDILFIKYYSDDNEDSSKKFYFTLLSENWDIKHYFQDWWLFYSKK